MLEMYTGFALNQLPIRTDWHGEKPPPPPLPATSLGSSAASPPTTLHLTTQQPQPASTSSSTSSTNSALTVSLNELAAASRDMTASEHLTNAGVNTPQYSVEYLSQLLKDKKQIAAFPNVFHHLERLADEEISRVRVALFQFEFSKGELKLPEAEGEVMVTTEKVFVPAKEYPDYNFVGRILGPRGMTAKQLEQETGCKIMVRGKGSMRDKKKEEANRGKPNWEHLSEELHVLIQCEDTANRTAVKLMRAVDEVKKLLVPAPEGEDELKRKQLMELAIINGTYRSNQDQNALAAAQLAALKQQPLAAALQAALAQQAQSRVLVNGGLNTRSPTMAGVAGAPIVMSPSTAARTASQNASQTALFMQQSAAAQQAALFQQQQQQQQQQAEYQQLLLNQGIYDLNAAAVLQQQLAGQSQLAAAYQLGGQYAADYGLDLNSAGTAATSQATGAVLNSRRVLGAARDHPYKQ